MKTPSWRIIRKFRAAHTAKYDHDLDRICAALREKQAKSNRRVVTRGPRLPRQEIDAQHYI
uniref:Uncharacterized protein n=1 Tax=Candidatus Kentrum sp. FM TaxID=2126340 RepID=A0A450WPJ0_9GAMM|nr:MAG: hypothetical protein BECKFM1743B_GA0114221_105843 [Candidatus Kentron sp. FM]